MTFREILMKSNWLIFALAMFVLAASVTIFQIVNARAKDDTPPVEVDIRIPVNIELAARGNYPVLISGYATVEPLETTQLSPQVSGEVTFLHEQFLEGGRVKQGDLLFSIEKDAYEASYLQAEALLMQARADLIEQQALADVAADEARRNPKMTYTDLSLRKPQLLSARASVKSAEAALRIARRDLDKCDVHAPFDALIVSTELGVGQFLAAGSPVAVLYGTKSAKVHMPIAGFDRAFLPDSLIGLPATLTVSGPDSNIRRGIIRHDTGTVDEDTRMSHVVVQVDDPYALKGNVGPLPFGSFVQISFEGRQLNNLYQLSQELVINRRVWVVNEAEEMTPKKVSIIREDGDYFYIRDGLKNGDKIITTLPDNPRAGMPVKVINTNTETDDEQV